MATETATNAPPAEGNRAGRPRDDAREQAILDAAIDLLAEVGYEAMTVEAVATRAKSSKATIYRRWPGKAELVADAIRRRHEPMLCEPENTGSLRGDLLALANLMCDQMNGTDGALICGLAVAVRSDADLGRLLSSFMHDQKHHNASLIISRAVDRGELPEGAGYEPLLEVTPGVALLRQMNGEPLDHAFAEYLVDRILIPLLRS
jgi:AcrR family transcriptional regulator